MFHGGRRDGSESQGVPFGSFSDERHRLRALHLLEPLTPRCVNGSPAPASAAGFSWAKLTMAAVAR
jgi:hypothetical protein